MNLLVNSDPEYITVKGIQIPIKTDFELWVSLLIAADNNDLKMLQEAVGGILGGIPSPKYQLDVISAMLAWVSGQEKGTDDGEKASSGATALDFEIDGSVIYCELWQHFPHLMEKGISYHEGIELIKLLIHDENTMLWHRVFARCGNFSKMTTDERAYWNKERGRYAILKSNRKIKQGSIDNVMSGAFM